MRTSTSITIALTLFLATLHLGCAGPRQPAWASMNPQHWPHRGATDEPLTFDIAGPVAIDIDSFNGDVYITSDPKLTHGTVTVVRQGLHGYKREREAKASLDEIQYEAAIVPGEVGPALRIVTSTQHAEPHFQRAHVYIEMPDVEGIVVRTRNGRVYASNIRGPVDIATTNGDVRVMSNQPITQPVTIVNRDGDIDYRVRGESTALFDAQAVNGRVRSRVSHGSLRVQATGSDSLQATLNQGSNPIVLRTANGDIRIAVVPNPEEVGQIIVF